MKITILTFVFVLSLLGVSPRTNAQSIVAGGSFSMALCSDDIVWAWGRNDNGQLGNGTLTQSPVPLQVFTDVASIATGSSYSLVLKNDSTVWAWGRNVSGQLGNGTFSTGGCQCIPFPAQVAGLTGVVAIAAASHQSYALKSDGTVWAWGNNFHGQLGDSTTINRNTPVQVKFLTGVVKIAAGTQSAYALKNDGTLWAWGRNNFGQLGDGTTLDSWIPVQVNSLTGIAAIDASAASAYVLKNDGTVWAWGYNGEGQFGNGTTIGSTSPMQIHSDAIAISGGGGVFMYIKTDSTVWASGYNTFGKLGDGTVDTTPCGCVLNPVQVMGMNQVIAIDAGELQHAIAMKSDGSLWTWGSNVYGELGDGTVGGLASCACKPSPVQIIGGLCLLPLTVNEIPNVREVTIYPNPLIAQGTIALSMELKNGSIAIYNSIGQKVRVYEHVFGSQLLFKRENLNAGLYFIIAKNANENAITQKFIIGD